MARSRAARLPDTPGRRMLDGGAPASAKVISAVSMPLVGGLPPAGHRISAASIAFKYQASPSPQSGRGDISHALGRLRTRETACRHAIDCGVTQMGHFWRLRFRADLPARRRSDWAGLLAAIPTERAPTCRRAGWSGAWPTSRLIAQLWCWRGPCFLGACLAG